uniref:Non-specific serine/threonine protein kinase n=1 Tax=Panagrellus redivivus TaxID=6233 RepID=A0A7E4VZY1_PANRE
MDSVNEHTHSYPESNRLLNSLSAGAEKQVDHWLVTLRTSMLSTLCNIVLCSDDALIAVLELDVIYWKSILVQLTNQSHPNMRNQIFVLLQNFFHRCNKRYQIEFVQQHGFLILASQLRKFPVNLTIADALFSMFCGECVIIKDGLDEEHVESIVCTPFRYASFHALFALLEASAVDQALFWTVCSTLQKIFEANVRLRRAMVDCGIADTLMNVLRLLSIQQQSIKRMIGPVFPIIDCWISFARSCITNVIVFADSHMYSQSKDFLLLCAVADYQLNSPAIKATAAERLRHFSESLSVPPPIQPMACSDCTRKMVRQILCQLIEAWLDCCMAVVVDPGNALIPVDERIEGDGGDSDSSYEMYSDSDLTESSMALYGAHGDRRHKKKSFEFAGVDELAVRLCFGLQMANDLFVCAQIPEQISEAEEGLFQKYLGILLLPWKKRNTDSMDDYLKLLAGIKEQARVQLAKLIAYVLFPVQLRQRQLIGAHQNLDLAGLVRRRLQIVRSLADMLSKDRDCISSLLEVDLDYQYAAKIALHELALCPQYAEFWPEFGEPLERLIRFLRTMQVESPLANLTRDEVNSMSIDEVILLHTYGEKTAGHAAKLQNEALRLCEKSAPLTKAVQESAVTLTCSIAVVQDEPRKLYIKSRKDAINACARANEVLTNLVVELCHPFAPFYDASSWPKGWSLDTTENLHRERKRLKPSHYRFDLKFLKPEKREEVGESGNVPPPLQKLREACPNFATTDYIEASNHVRLSLSAILVRSDYECSGEIIISDRKIHFLGEAAKSTQKGVTCQPVTLAWSYGQLSEINLRHYLLKDNALELFTTTGDAFLIVFATTPDRDNFVEQLNRMDIGKLMADHEKQLKLATQLWRRGSMTNFDYIMMVNKLAGRSFNDLMQYPVFPFILANYTAPVLDLNMVASYRDLSRPMAIQKKSMEEFYVRNYEQLHEESHQEDVEQFTTASFGAYHYGSHYSNTGVIAYYLVRVLPYTNVALEYQDNNFDIPDRLFNSIETAWRLSSSDSTTDFKELTPEFFFLPELFQNREQLNLGLRQAGSTVGDVVLPTWCPENNFRLFILIHRQALESAVVTANLHGWIDLIFGSKQQGPAAVKAINVFHPATYRGRDFESKQSHDEISLSALRTMIRTYGQMPTQLFLSPHLPHLNLPHPPLDAVMSPGAGETGHPSSFLPSVKGLRWGEFVGSPELDRRLWLQPVLNLNLSSGVDSIGKLVPVNKEGFCYALPEMTELVHRIVVDAKDPLRRTFETAMIAVVSWRFSDNVLRLKVVQMDDSVWVNLIDLQVFEPTRVVFSPNANQMYIGTSCGLIRVYSIDFKKDSKTWQVKLVSELFAHRSAISTLKVSDDFHLVLSTSADGQAHSWDSNQLTYIRQFVPPPSEAVETITLTAISSVSADIAIIYQSHRGSRLVLYTINGDVIGTYESDPDSIITSVAMTNMDEGTGINCIALGMQNGIVRILESWTLSLVTDISVGANVPVTSVEFTNEGRRMYVAVATGRVFCWQGATAASINATAFRGRAKFDPAVKLLNPFTD